MQKITPHLWFDKEAKEAADFYVSLFPNSKIKHISTIHNVPTPTGDCDIVSFELTGQPFMAINAGPLFKFNPSISFHVKCKTKEEAQNMWNKLSADGQVLMEFSKYPWSEMYGWCTDTYGLSWQVIYVGDAPINQKITPVVMYVGPVAGRAEEAVKFYTSVFRNSKYDIVSRYGKDEGPDKEGTVRYAYFSLGGMELGAMDSAHEHKFAFNEAISLLIPCETQEEIDYYWEKLSADPNAEQCGWLKDTYGVSWQVWPVQVGEMMKNGTREQIDRVTQAFLPMKKFDIVKLKGAYEGK